MPELETLEAAASETEQPEAVQAETEHVEGPESTEAAPVETETAEVQETAPRLYADKYKSPEELERAYRDSNAENSRMAAELARLRQPSQQKQTTEPKYTADQLETWKEGRIREVARYENLADRLASEGRHTEAQQAAAQAAESARQVRLIDSELRKMDIRSSLQESSRTGAEQRLVSDATSVLRQYQGDLVPGTELYNKASYFMDGFVAMGQDKDSPLVQAQAVLMAASVLGLPARKVEQTTRKELTKTMSQALKSGIKAGAGKASKSAGYPDFAKMSDADFIKYKADRGWD